MSKPFILSFHPEAEVGEKLHKVALSMGARARSLHDAESIGSVHADECGATLRTVERVHERLHRSNAPQHHRR